MTLEAALAKARIALAKPTLRSRTLNFTANSKSLSATWNATEGRWRIEWTDRQAAYDVRKANRQGRLVVYAWMVRYREPGSQVRQAALCEVPVRLDETGTSAIPLGSPVPNATLIHRLAVLGVKVAFEDGEYRLEKAEDVAALTGEHRIGASPPGMLSIASYVDTQLHPGALANPTLRFFVEGRPGQQLPQPVLSSSILSRTSGSKPASEGSDSVGPSQRPPEAVWTLDSGLDPDQRHALKLALEHPLVLIEGPPGTGKSHVITALARALDGQRLRLLVTSTERSAVDVARRRVTEALGSGHHVLIGTPDEIAMARPPEIGVPDFDLLVVDECSMMPMHLALPLMTRAKAYVLIGDGQQLRPDDDAATVLDRATQLAIPTAALRFHYRSRERSLIGISNLLAYGMALRTVPNPELRPKNGLKIVFLPDGHTEKGPHGSVNHGEARAILERIRSHLQSNSRLSLGVITANTAQKLLIEAMVRALGDPRPPRLHEPLFVRTTQEIQGEERDIILISTVYDGRAPDQRFGIFETPRWVQRINVMLSRSREEMRLFTSFSDERAPPPQITAGRAAFTTLSTLVRAQSESQTKAQRLPAMDRIAHLLRMRGDNLGTVYGLRYAGDDHYRIGIVLTNDMHSEEHDGAIVDQLAAKGWKVLRQDKNDLIRSPDEARARIAKALEAKSSP